MKTHSLTQQKKKVGDKYPLNLEELEAIVGGKVRISVCYDLVRNNIKRNNRE